MFYVPSTAWSFRDGTPIYCPVKDVKLGKYIVPTRNRTPGGRVAVHSAALRKLHNKIKLLMLYINKIKNAFHSSDSTDIFIP